MEGVTDETLTILSDAANVGDTMVDVSGQGAKLCNADLTMCARITGFASTLEGHGGKYLGWIGVSFQCADDLDRECAWAIASEAFEKVPVAGQIWIGVKAIDLIFGTNMEDSVKEAVFQVLEEFFNTENHAPPLTHDPDVTATRGGQAVLPHGGQNPGMYDCGITVDQTGGPPVYCEDR